MVSAVLALALAVVQGTDTSTYADEHTARLIARARVRHHIQDTLVHDYAAVVRTRVDVGVGRSRFARVLPLVALETAAQITWARPNDLRVKIVGQRSASSIRGAKIDGSFGDPWFIPRGLGDSIRFIDQELPETPALHPLAPTGAEFYRYAVFDSLAIELPDRRVSAIGVRVEPKWLAASLIAGNLWLDAETAEVVRLTFTYVGEYLWDTPDDTTAADSADARKNTRQANRIIKVDADLQYALHQARYWMPYRQLVTLTAEIPWFVNATIPVHFITTFGEYQINQGIAPLFTLGTEDSASTQDGDSAATERCRDRECRRRRREHRAEHGYTRSQFWDGGRWELEVPPRDSLAGYQWPEPLALQPDAATEQLIREATATLARVEQDLPAELVNRHPVGVAFERLSDLFRFNRVQGPSLGAGVRLASRGFNSLLASVRFGFSDLRPTGSLTLRREAPGGRLDLSVWRSMRETESWGSRSAFGNSINAALAAHDDADYYLALGGGITFLGNTGLTRDAELDFRYEQARSVATQAHSGLNDLLGGSGQFPANPTVLEGDFLRAAISRRSYPHSLEVRYGVEGLAGLGGTVSDAAAARAWISARARFELVGRTGALTLRAGTTAGDSIPQFLFRVGGPETVRGYNYGTRTGRSAWAAQIDFALNKGNMLSPVVFADAGNTSISGTPLTSVGAGLSIFGGLMRFNLSKGLTPEADIRFDLLFRAAR